MEVNPPHLTTRLWILFEYASRCDCRRIAGCLY